MTTVLAGNSLLSTDRDYSAGFACFCCNVPKITVAGTHSTYARVDFPRQKEQPEVYQTYVFSTSAENVDCLDKKSKTVYVKHFYTPVIKNYFLVSATLAISKAPSKVLLPPINPAAWTNLDPGIFVTLSRS